MPTSDSPTSEPAPSAGEHARMGDRGSEHGGAGESGTVRESGRTRTEGRPGERLRLLWCALACAALVVQLLVLYLPTTPDTSGSGLPPWFDKVVHLAVFAAVTVTALFARPRFLTRGRTARGAAALTVALSALHAPLSEVIQHVTLPHRSGDPADVLADLAGVALGWATWWALRPLLLPRAHNPRAAAGQATGQRTADQ